MSHLQLRPGRVRRLRALAALLAACVAAPAMAYESDVHYGLTRWLALRAGFDDSQSTAIALGDQRVDGGMMETLALVLEFACTSPDPEVAREVQARHFPTATPVPAPASDRRVEPGSAAARQLLVALGPRLPGKEGLMLGKLGEALHPLQDSWAHQGLPSTTAVPGVPCDPALVSGMASSHEGELTRSAPAQVLAMARATYEALVAYPKIQNHARAAARWEALVPDVTAFAALRTKAAKADWFRRNGVEDVSFLEGTSLPDGALARMPAWDGRKLPELPRNNSIQHDVPTDARDYVDQLLAGWLGDDPAHDAPPQGSGRARPARMSRDLATRLRLWRWRDHGAVAALAHAARALTAGQVASADRLTRDPAGFARGSVADSVFPLQPLQPPGAPLVPYVLRPLPVAQGQPARMLAMLRLRHAPYDTLGLVIEQVDGRWALADIQAVVDR